MKFTVHCLPSHLSFHLKIDLYNQFYHKKAIIEGGGVVGTVSLFVIPALYFRIVPTTALPCGQNLNNTGASFRALRC